MKIVVSDECINKLDLSPIEVVVSQLEKTKSIAFQEIEIELAIDYLRDPEDPRELSEISEVRLWFIRLDTRYPWLPLILNWKSGELARYIAMLVPHTFHRRDGIQYNPEALEIFLMHKIFILADWLKQEQAFSKSKLMAFAKMLGYDLDEAFFELLN